MESIILFGNTECTENTEYRESSLLGAGGFFLRGLLRALRALCVYDFLRRTDLARMAAPLLPCGQ